MEGEGDGEVDVVEGPHEDDGWGFFLPPSSRVPNFFLVSGGEGKKSVTNSRDFDVAPAVVVIARVAPPPPLPGVNGDLFTRADFDSRSTGADAADLFTPLTPQPLQLVLPSWIWADSLQKKDDDDEDAVDDDDEAKAAFLGRAEHVWMVRWCAKARTQRAPPRTAC